MHVGLLVSLATLLATTLTESKLMTLVPASSQVCFEEECTSPNGLRGKFQVLDDERMDVRVYKGASSGTDPALVSRGATEGDLDVHQGPGRYVVCFKNQMSSSAQ